MITLLMILGIGATYGLVTLLDGSDDDDSGDDAAETSYGPEDDVVSDVLYRDAFVAGLTDLVAEGELTQAEADAGLQSIVFTAGPQFTATEGGDDIVLGGPGDDRIDAGIGDDAVIGGEGDDRIRLGDGADAYGSGVAVIDGEDDFFSVTSDFSPFAADAVTEGGDDTVLGGDDGDFLYDSFGANLLQGQQGDDWISAVDADGLSPDTVDAGYGDDVLFVDLGDLVTGGPGADSLTVDVSGGIVVDDVPVEVMDYEPDADVLVLRGQEARIVADATTGIIRDPVTVVDLPGGVDALVAINDVPVALLRGGQGLTPQDIIRA